VPDKPFRAPPAPYERASLLAYYCKNNKPKSKILVVDPDKEFHKQELFEQAWAKLYPNVIERIHGQVITQIDAKNKIVTTSKGDVIKADVLNIIPPQKASILAHHLELADHSGWCPVNAKTFQSKRFENVYVIGDAAIAGDMPKSAFAASSQAKACAAAVVANIYQIDLPDIVLNSGFYSFVNPKYAISSTAAYRVIDNKITITSGGNSPLKAKKRTRFKEAKFAKGWYAAITKEAFGV